jgi:hypothetical protein
MAQPETLLIGRVDGAPRAVRTPSGVTVTMLTLTVCGEAHELVTFGTEAERAAELVAGQVVSAEGRWQVREEGRRELAVSSFAALPPRAPAGLAPEQQRRNAEWEHWFYGGRPDRPEEATR